MEKAPKRAGKSDKDRPRVRERWLLSRMTSKTKRVFNDLNCRENIYKNILSLKEIYGMKNKKRLLWCILNVMGDSVSSRSPSRSLPPSAPKRRCSDGSRRHTGTAGLIWLISVRTTSNQEPHPVSLTPVAPWDTSIYTLTQHCNSPKCLHQPNRWDSGRATKAVQHGFTWKKNNNTWLMCNDDQFSLFHCAVMCDSNSNK